MIGENGCKMHCIILKLSKNRIKEIEKEEKIR
jgi:hypothetical protein